MLLLPSRSHNVREVRLPRVVSNGLAAHIATLTEPLLAAERPHEGSGKRFFISILWRVHISPMEWAAPRS